VGPRVFLAGLVGVGGSLLSTSVMIGLKLQPTTATEAERPTLGATQEASITVGELAAPPWPSHWPPTEAASEAYFEPLVSLPRSYIKASFWPHRCHFKQAGHSNRNLRSDSELNLIFSVVRPVGTILPKFGHRIIISGIPYYCIPASFIKLKIRTV
jgi:hypothetical protein